MGKLWDTPASVTKLTPAGDEPHGVEWGGKEIHGSSPLLNGVNPQIMPHEKAGKVRDKQGVLSLTKELHPNPGTSGEFNSRGTRRSTGLEDTSRGTSGEEDPKGRAAPGFVCMPFPIPGQWQGPGCSQPRSRMPEEPLSCSLPPQEQLVFWGVFWGILLPPRFTSKGVNGAFV